MDCPVTARPTVIVISDSLGDTACEVVLAASGQFDEGAFRVLRLPKVTSVEQVKSFVGPHVDADHRDIAVFHTIVDPALRARVLDYLGMLHIRSVDLIGPTLAVLSSLIGVPPKGVAGVIHKTDDRYFHRIEAMEYFVEHDDGRGCDDLSGADIVLLGVSRTSKTPLSMYLAYQGYKVANVPLAHGMEPPKSIYEVDPMRLFGLISTVDVISEIRDSRLGDDYAREELYQNVYRVLHGDNPDDPTFVTVSTFLRNGSSLENTAKDLNVHPNTVRYRLKRAAETTGWDATDPRDAYVLTTALAIGRMRDR